MNRVIKAALALSGLLLFPSHIFPQTTFTVTIGPGGQRIFSPSDLTINPGDTVRWEWSSSNHSTTSDASTGPEVWDSGVLNAGSVFSKVFLNPGSYPYHCTPHQASGMVGTITVADIVGVESGSGTFPYRVHLSQNYPNPFNPATIITYQVPKSSLITISVTDINGRLINTLVNNLQDAGSHSIMWNGKDSYGHTVSAGVYLYRIQAGNYTQMRKMVLLK
ncbi:MAG: plastocyanin/azurin family copper-binding protein [Fidelibacterota bacterium]